MKKLGKLVLVTVMILQQDNCLIIHTLLNNTD